MTKPNGTNGWLGKMMLGGLFVIATGTTGATANWLLNQQSRSQVIQSEHGERISGLEAVQKSIGATLVRLDRKMDRVLERVSR